MGTQTLYQIALPVNLQQDHIVIIDFKRLAITIIKIYELFQTVVAQAGPQQFFQ